MEIYHFNNAVNLRYQTLIKNIKNNSNSFYDSFLDLLEEGNFESIMYNDDCDGIHPNQEFITNVMAPQIANFIKDNYQ